MSLNLCSRPVRRNGVPVAARGRPAAGIVQRLRGRESGAGRGGRRLAQRGGGPPARHGRRVGGGCGDGLVGVAHEGAAKSGGKRALEEDQFMLEIVLHYRL